MLRSFTGSVFDIFVKSLPVISYPSICVNPVSGESKKSSSDCKPNNWLVTPFNHIWSLTLTALGLFVPTFVKSGVCILFHLLTVLSTILPVPKS